MSHKVLVVGESHPPSSNLLNPVLLSRGYDVRTAASHRSALIDVEAWDPEVVIANVMRPAFDSLDFCRTVRLRSTVPIIVLSEQVDEGAAVAALDSGADDYVTKPFGMDELLARVRVALRRSERVTTPGSLAIGDFLIDFDQRRVHTRGRQVRLTPKEFDLFAYMARHPNRTLSHRRLLSAVWGEDYVAQPEYLRVFMVQLRRKLDYQGKPRHFITEPWVGYRFNPVAAGAPDARGTGVLAGEASSASPAFQ